MLSNDLFITFHTMIEILISALRLFRAQIFTLPLQNSSQVPSSCLWASVFSCIYWRCNNCIHHVNELILSPRVLLNNVPPCHFAILPFLLLETQWSVQWAGRYWWPPGTTTLQERNTSFPFVSHTSAESILRICRRLEYNGKKAQD